MKGSNGPMKQPDIPRFNSKYGPKVNVHSENPGMDFLKRELKIEKYKSKRKKK